MNKRLLIVSFIWLPTLLCSQPYNDYLGNGHQLDIRATSSDERNAQMSASHTLNGFPGEEQAILADVSRFLAQATFGASYEEIEKVAGIGYEAWIKEQVEMAPSYLVPTAWAILEADAEQSGEDDLFLTKDFFRSAWFHTSMTAPDQLKQRVALAWSEIMVISDHPDELEDSGLGLSHYYDILLQHGLGNYRDLLLEVSLHPTMGFYLSHFNNPKSDPSQNIHPDENYAREVMQLFSIGLYELNLDGSQKLDANGNPIPTYSNTDIKEYAKIFTGLSGANYHPLALEEFGDDKPEFELDFGISFEDTKHDERMKMYEEWHEPGPKYLLNGQVIPAGQSGIKDIEDAIDNLFNHPNVGPFISRRLIQRLVTSNPSPAYIERVARTFNKNGQGIRGDLGAVVKAILMDEEARGCDNRLANEHRAMLREPLIRYLHFCRAMHIVPKDNRDFFFNPGWRFEYATGQFPLSAPSVFNFFLPDYQPNGLIATLDLFGPEFQIHNSASSINYFNEVHDWTFNQAPVVPYDPVDLLLDGESLPEDDIMSESSVEVPLEILLDMAAEPEVLLDHLNLLFAHNQLSNETYSTILEAIRALENEEDRVQMALYLLLISPDYAILN